MVDTMNASQNSGAKRAVKLEAVEDEKAEARTEAPASPPTAPTATAAATEQKAEPKKKKRGVVLPIVVLALLAGGAWYGYETTKEQSNHKLEYSVKINIVLSTQ